VGAAGAMIVAGGESVETAAFLAESPMSNPITDRVAALRWFHSIDLGGGIVTPGQAPISELRDRAAIYFADGIVGKSVLDIGCWDGFNSLEAARRGAARVVATDHWVWHHHEWASRRTIELVREVAAPDLEIRDIDVADLSLETVGVFDVVLFCGVFYHLRNPFLALEKIARLARETLIVETHLDAGEIDRPAMIFYPGSELNVDPSNWWGPNRLCVEAMLRDVGFSRIDYTAGGLNRGIFRARRAR
jgi:tRNA (mo5U34)-methyltransferase